MNYKKMIAEKVKALNAAEELKKLEAERVLKLRREAFQPVLELFEAVQDMEIPHFRHVETGKMPLAKAFSLDLQYSTTAPRLEAWTSMGQSAWAIYPAYCGDTDSVSLNLCESRSAYKRVTARQAIDFITDHIAKLVRGKSV